MKADATVIIAVRNAAATIQRAVRSAVIQGNSPILLIDDFSTDDTVALAIEAGAGRLKVVRPDRHRSLGLTRQAGLDAVETPFGVWLDADDEFLPGRVERLLESLVKENGDLATDAIELYDGTSAQFLKHLPIPEFLKGRQPLARLFERNYLQGIGVIAFRTGFARQIGFDPELHGAEDMDFALRAVASGARFCFLDVPGYRLYSYPSSTSRQRENQLEMYRLCLLKHDYDAVRHLFQQAGYSPQSATWGLVSMAQFRGDFERALDFVSEAESQMANPSEILEPSGPCPMQEGWRLAFFRGTAMLMLEQWHDAEIWLDCAEKIQPTAEAANNLGVALAKLGKPQKAHKLFLQSLALFTEYSDAKANRDSETASRITLHPLRREPSRMDYQPSPQSPIH